MAYDLPVAAGAGLEIGSAGYELRGSIDDPLAVMALHGHGPGAVHADPAAVYRGEPGVPTTVELDLVWTTDGTPYHYDLTTRYEVPCLVSGEVTVGGETDGRRWPRPARPLVGGPRLVGLRMVLGVGPAGRWHQGALRRHPDARVPDRLRLPPTPGGPVIPVESIEVTEVIGREGFPERPRGDRSGGSRAGHRAHRLRTAAAGGARRPDQPVPAGGGPLRGPGRSRRNRLDRVEPAGHSGCRR